MCIVMGILKQIYTIESMEALPRGISLVTTPFNTISLGSGEVGLALVGKSNNALMSQYNTLHDKVDRIQEGIDK